MPFTDTSPRRLRGRHDFRRRYLHKGYLWPWILIILVPFALRLVMFYDVSFPFQSSPKGLEDQNLQLYRQSRDDLGGPQGTVIRPGEDKTIHTVIRPDEDAWKTHDDFIHFKDPKEEGTETEKSTGAKKTGADKAGHQGGNKDEELFDDLLDDMEGMVDEKQFTDIGERIRFIKERNGQKEEEAEEQVGAAEQTEEQRKAAEEKAALETKHSAAEEKRLAEDRKTAEHIEATEETDSHENKILSEEEEERAAEELEAAEEMRVAEDEMGADEEKDTSVKKDSAQEGEERAAEEEAFEQSGVAQKKEETPKETNDVVGEELAAEEREAEEDLMTLEEREAEQEIEDAKIKWAADGEPKGAKEEEAKEETNDEQQRREAEEKAAEDRKVSQKETEDARKAAEEAKAVKERVAEEARKAEQQRQADLNSEGEKSAADDREPHEILHNEEEQTESAQPAYPEVNSSNEEEQETENAHEGEEKDAKLEEQPTEGQTQAEEAVKDEEKAVKLEGPSNAAKLEETKEHTLAEEKETEEERSAKLEGEPNVGTNQAGAAKLEVPTQGQTEEAGKVKEGRRAAKLDAPTRGQTLEAEKENEGESAAKLEVPAQGQTQEEGKQNEGEIDAKIEGPAKFHIQPSDTEKEGESAAKLEDQPSELQTQPKEKKTEDEKEEDLDSLIQEVITTEDEKQEDLDSLIHEVITTEDQIGEGAAGQRECDLFDGDWVYDPEPPLYTNATCFFIRGDHNCMSNGRPDTDYLHWKWKPRKCDLPRFDPFEFMKAFRNKTIGFIGDSLARNQMQSMLCMLSMVEVPIKQHDDDILTRWFYERHRVTLTVAWSPYLLKESSEGLMGFEKGQSVLFLDVLDPIWTSMLPDMDLVVLSVGQWYFKPSVYVMGNEVIGCHYCPELNLTQIGFYQAYSEGLRHSLEHVASSGWKGTAVVSTFAPAHGEKRGGADQDVCLRTRPLDREEFETSFRGLHYEMRDVLLGEYKRVLKDHNHKERDGFHLEFLDVGTLSILRADGHPGAYYNADPYEGKRPDEWVFNDCLHWCLPGPVDTWNQLLVRLSLKYF